MKKNIGPLENIDKTKINFQIYDLKNLKQEQQDLIKKYLFEISHDQVQSITLNYLQERMTRYDYCLIANYENVYLGFMFLHFKKNIIHVGLSVMKKEFRYLHLTTWFVFNFHKYLKKTYPFSFRFLCWFKGFFLTGKCSSPVSFYALQRYPNPFQWPKIASPTSLTYMSRSFFGRFLSFSIGKSLGFILSGPFVIRNVNKDSGFLLKQEDYKFKTPKAKRIGAYFEKNIFPHHELLSVTWIHPIMILFWGVDKNMKAIYTKRS